MLHCAIANPFIDLRIPTLLKRPEPVLHIEVGAPDRRRRLLGIGFGVVVTAWVMVGVLVRGRFLLLG